ncbi:MAG: ABC transporter permease [Steroidobacteraceae bacterium]
MSEDSSTWSPRAHRTLPWAALLQHRLALAGLVLLLVMVLLSIFGPSLGQDPNVADAVAIYQAPSGTHLFGTDHLGRDLFARVLLGGRLSMQVGVFAILIAAVLGGLYGLVSGLGPRWLDHLMMQLLDTLLSIPVILFAVLIQATGEPGVLRLSIAIALVSWMGVARIVRTECQQLMRTDFVLASIASGSGALQLVARHLLPNIARPLLVVLTVSIGQALILEATLSFLNLGVPANIPSWGNLLGSGMRAALSGAWWAVLFPGLAIVLAVVAINFIGDGLRDAADPRRRLRL